ncbi:MAG: hypothetical protein QF718_04050 [Phycisphaerales bacterium]|jgi:hypothetical protein|nr:hypothetical protein [Phycisphaerales bacterium]
MTKNLQEFLSRITSWPRAMQWAFWAAVITIGFLIWDSTVADLNEIWSDESAQIELHITEVNKPVHITSSVKNAITSFGKVELPREKSHGAAALTEAVQGILGSHPVRKDEYTRTKTSRMKSGSLPGIASSSQNVEQVIGDIRFEATQEEVLSVISALESNPWIDALTNVRLTKKDGRWIQVDLSVEAWVVSSKKRRGNK